MGTDPSVEEWKYMDRKGVIPHRDYGNLCLRTSFLNGLRLFCSNGKDEEFIRKEKYEMEGCVTTGNCIRRYRGARCLSKAMGEFLPGFELGHVLDGSGGRKEASGNFLVRRRIEGVLLITVRAVRGMPHAVVVDARYKPGCVLDRVEKHPMPFCRESLALCFGSDKEFDCLQDVRVLRWKPSRSGVRKVNKKKRKRRKE